jgi:SPP1 gp7 family putative phage head morphogenesis protein
MYYQIEHLPDEVLIELYYELQKDKDIQNILELPLWFESLTEEDVLFKSQSIDTDKQELDIKVLLLDILRESEKDTIAALYKANKNKLSKIYIQLKNTDIEDRIKEVNNGSYIYMKSTLPVFVKEITSAEVNLIVTFNTVKTNKELLSVILSAGQAGVNRAYKDAGLKSPYNLSTSKFAEAYKDRARKFSEAVSDNVQSRIRGEIVNGIKAGEGVDIIAQRVREAYKKPIEVKVAANKERKEYTRTLDNKKWSQMVAQTETSWAANQGRLDAYKQSDLVKNVKWITKYNPCADCGALRGRILTLEEATNMIPLHPNCHCSYVVNEYKERTEQPDTGFENTADKIYANPNGIGIMEMMKMSKSDDAKFMDLLDKNKIKEAEKMLRSQHLVSTKVEEIVRNEQLSIDTIPGLIKQVEKDTGLIGQEAINMTEAVQSFTGNSYEGIRAVQMGQIPKFPAGVEDISSFTEKGNIIEKYITKAPKYTKEIYRGIDLNLDRSKVEEIFKVGDIVDMKGTSSWSTKFETVKQFGPIRFISEDTPLSTAIGHLSIHPTESEVIVSKTVKFKIIKIERTTGYLGSFGTNIYVKGEIV